MVTAPPLLKYYEREKDLVIQCDASKGGLVNGHEAEMFRFETKNDGVLQAAKATVQSEWPAEKRDLPPTVAIYYDIC